MKEAEAQSSDPEWSGLWTVRRGEGSEDDTSVNKPNGIRRFKLTERKKRQRERNKSKDTTEERDVKWSLEDSSAAAQRKCFLEAETAK